MHDSSFCATNLPIPYNRSQTISVLLCCLLILIAGCTYTAESIHKKNINPEAFEQQQEAIPLVPATLRSEKKVDSILVQKAKRQLTTFCNQGVIKRYTIALGAHPVGDKQRKGDGKTPEGLFRIDYHNPNSDYHYALHISYPDEAHRKRAAALKADPGGDIFIHGLPNGMPTSQRHRLAKDWTRGCIALTNEEIMELARTVATGTPIRILP